VPAASATRLSARGFHKKSDAAQQLLETVGRSFRAGYVYAVEARSPLEAEESLEKVPEQFRGFAYEGAAMGLAILDGLPLPGDWRIVRFLAGRADRYVYMTYVGVGWAMARLPRFRWSKLTAPDPLLRWLVLDGYGFHQAYFRTRQYVTKHYQQPRLPWPGGRHAWYATRAVDQGIGRALWYVAGTDPHLVSELIDDFPATRRSDLYSGVGLAATYAGGADETELGTLRERAGRWRPNLAQGSAFAARAQVRAGLVPPHTETATRVFCGMSTEGAARVTDEAVPERAAPNLPSYERWRQSIAESFATAYHR